MHTTDKTTITVEASVDAPIEKIWKLWTSPEHIIQWNQASQDWHTTKAENDLRVGGQFLSRMEAKDDSFGFDFAGIYDEVKINELVAYTMADGRKVTITFTGNNNQTLVSEIFEAETINSIQLQKAGWQSILDNFKKYAEAQK